MSLDAGGQGREPGGRDGDQVGFDLLVEAGEDEQADGHEDRPQGQLASAGAA